MSEKEKKKTERKKAAKQNVLETIGEIGQGVNLKQITHHCSCEFGRAIVAESLGELKKEGLVEKHRGEFGGTFWSLTKKAIALKIGVI